MGIKVRFLHVKGIVRIFLFCRRGKGEDMGDGLKEHEGEKNNRRTNTKHEENNKEKDERYLSR